MNYLKIEEDRRYKQIVQKANEIKSSNPKIDVESDNGKEILAFLPYCYERMQIYEKKLEGNTTSFLNGTLAFAVAVTVLTNSLNLLDSDLLNIRVFIPVAVVLIIAAFLLGLRNIEKLPRRNKKIRRGNQKLRK